MNAVLVLLPADLVRAAPVRRRARGFTLIELMVTVALIAIGLALAAPSMTRMVRANRVQTEAGSFVNDLQAARAEAVKRGDPVSVCASKDGIACSGQNQWQAGWITFADPVPTATCAGSNTSTRPLLRRHLSLRGGDTLASDTNANKSCITFNRQGFTSNLGTGTVTFALHVADTSDSAKAATRCVAVDLGGRVSVQTAGQTGTSCL